MSKKSPETSLFCHHPLKHSVYFLKFWNSWLGHVSVSPVVLYLEDLARAFPGGFFEALCPRKLTEI